jgi:type IV pilus assembly protein PilQ
MISIIALTLAVVAPPAVRGLSVTPVADRTEVVIRVDGNVTATDFALTGPARVVIDITGMGMVEKLEHRIDRGGVRSLRLGAFQPGVGRLVIDLVKPVEYRVDKGEQEIRISFPNTFGAFEPWSSAPATPAAELPQPAAPELPPARSAQLPPINVIFTEEPLSNVIAAFGDFSGRTIIAQSDVKGKTITAEVKNQPWDIALEAILQANGLIATEQETGVLVVQDISQVTKTQAEEPLVSRQFPIRYVSADTLVASVKALLTTRGQVVANRTTNSILVTEGSSVLERVAPMIQELDAPVPQVNIAATIAFVDRTALEQLGVTYDVKDSRGTQLNTRVPGYLDTNGDGLFQASEQTKQDVVLLGGNSVAALANANYPVPSPALQLVSSLVLGRHTLITFLEALQTVTLSDIQAKPVVTVMNHRQAHIQVGQRTPVRVIDAAAAAGGGGAGGGGGGGGGSFPIATVDYVNTGVILRVTPHITGNQVLLDLIAERSDAVPASSDIGFVFTTQNAQTQVLVQDGETTVIGGLTITEKSKVRAGVPLLMDLPVIGALFRNNREQENKRDLLIMVTPHIVRS